MVKGMMKPIGSVTLPPVADKGEGEKGKWRSPPPEALSAAKL